MLHGRRAVARRAAPAFGDGERRAQAVDDLVDRRHVDVLEQTVRREDGQAGVVHVGEADHDPVGAVVAGGAALVAKREGGLVAVVAVGDQHLLVGQQRDHAVDGGAGDRAQAAGVAVAVEGFEGGRGGRRSRRQGPPDLVVGVGVEQKDLAYVGVGRAQQLEAVHLGAGVGLFVG